MKLEKIQKIIDGIFLTNVKQYAFIFLSSE